MKLVIDSLREHQQINLIKIYENEYSKLEIMNGVFRGKTVREIVRDMSEVGRSELESYLANRPAPLVMTDSLLWTKTIDYFTHMEIHEDDARFKSQKQEAYLKAYRQHSENMVVGVMFHVKEAP
ncbi:MAG: hypothetical protein ACRCST_00300 [Turicibacter sp.]